MANSAELNEVEQQLVAGIQQQQRDLQQRTNSILTSLLAARGVKQAARIRVSEDGKNLEWDEPTEGNGSPALNGVGNAEPPAAGEGGGDSTE